ncbi:MAG TPA: RagB/SusD family nutrient uptake outer membrane protein [Gemmatimonadales bacterium]|nr:RagB/SusD family nutrient uptake outer membrane protein [Gemmatimonadales bacterium]
MRLSTTALLAGLVALGACNFDLSTNPNSPDPIGSDPSRNEISVAANGLLIAFRNDLADFALDVGIFGREVLRFDGSDPRFTGELLHGPLDPGGDAFGGDHWGDEYTAIRGGNLILSVLPTATQLSAEEQSATSGYVKTIQAFNYLLVLNSHTQDSIPIVTDTSITAPPAPFQTNAAAFDHVVALLDQAAAELAAGGAAFPFPLPAGFSGFSTPATFAQFNRALRARVAAYRQDWNGVLTALATSFIDPAAPLDRGVYMDYGTGPGDLANPLSIDPLQGENFAHPSLRTGAQLQVDGVTPDARFASKTVTRPVGSADDLSSDLGWVRYPSPNSPIPIIKNEELILLRAEANIGLGLLPSALPDINTVRTLSGNLPALADLGTPEQAVTELLYNRLYSLLFEGGHRWIDARRYGRLATLPLDRTTRPDVPPDQVFATFPIPSDEVLPRQ